MVIIGAGINGLVAANLAQQKGWQVTLLERHGEVGGACVAATAELEGQQHDYALGASVLGLMQDFVWQQTGLANRLQAWAPTHPKLVHFPQEQEPAWIYRDPERLDQEFRQRFGEKGDLAKFRADEDRVVRFLQQGYATGHAPTLEAAEAALGAELTALWISGSAQQLLTHYLTAERTRLYMAMTVTESSPVSLREPGTAFTIPMMDSGSVFGSYYGFVRGGIWQVTRTLADLNRELGVQIRTGCHVDGIDVDAGTVHSSAGTLPFDELVLATDPVTASRLTGNEPLAQRTAKERVLGSAGKLNLLFRRPVRWKHGSTAADSDAAFRFLFAVDSLDAFEQATLAVLDGKTDYAPGYYQVYCEGAAMRQQGLHENYDRLAVFFKNLALSQSGEQLAAVEQDVIGRLRPLIENPEDLAWSRLLTPRDLQQRFGFPGGNLEHTELAPGQLFAERGYCSHPQQRFYGFGDMERVSLCGSSTYPCGSVAGTPAWMCIQELLRHRSGAAVSQAENG